MRRHDKRGTSMKRFAKRGLTSIGFALLIVFVAWRISSAAEVATTTEFGLLRASSPAQERPGVLIGGDPGNDVRLRGPGIPLPLLRRRGSLTQSTGAR
jgi:hypothetical protein